MIKDGEITEVKYLKKEIKAIHCDGCDKIEKYNPNKGMWNDDGKDYENTEVNARLIIGGRYMKYDFDVCPTCFRQKIVPLFNENSSVENRVEKIRDEVEKMRENIKKRNERFQESARKSNSMSEHAACLENIAKCVGQDSALYDVLNIIRSFD